MKKLRVVIIGGTSKFGQLWKKYFESKGHSVLVSTNSTQIKPKEAVCKGDIIIISVPIRYTVEVIKELIPFIGENKLLIDFTGIKIETKKQLLNYTKGEIVSIHPMFGPWISSLKNQNISYDPIVVGEKWDYLHNLFENDGANLICLEGKKHDELVSIVQSTVHIMNLLLGHILKKRGIKINELMSLSTPNSRMQLCILSRFLNQNASLYTDMQMYNDLYKKEILPDIKDYFDLVGDLINNKKHSEFENEFNEIKTYIGEGFLQKAFKITSELDKTLKKDF